MSGSADDLSSDALPVWMVPYAERLYARFPEVLSRLGHPSLCEEFFVPPSPSSRVEVTDTANRKTIRVWLGRQASRKCEPMLQKAPCNMGTSSSSGFGNFCGGNSSVLPSAMPYYSLDPQLTIPNAAPFVSAPPSVPSPGRRGRDPSSKELPRVSQLDRQEEEPASPRSPGSYRPWAAERPKNLVPRKSNPPKRNRASISKEGAETLGVAESLGAQRGRATQAARASVAEVHSRPSTYSLREDRTDESHESLSGDSVYHLQPHSESPDGGHQARRFKPPERRGPHSASVGGSRGGAETPDFGETQVLHKDKKAASSNSSGEEALGLSSAIFNTLSLAGLEGHRSQSSSESPHRGSLQEPRPEVARRKSLSSRRGLVLTLPTAEGQQPDVTTPGNASKASVEDGSSSKGSGDEKSLAARRGSFLSLKREPSKFTSGGSACHSPENKQPAVQLLSRQRTNSSLDGVYRTISTRLGSTEQLAVIPDDGTSVPRPLPGSFPNRRTVFFFDWDDTLCPTSWIRSILREHIDDLKEWADLGQADNEVEWRDAVPGWFSQPLPDEPLVHECIADLQQAVINVIECAQAHGVVCIVTNAVPGWIDKTIKKWLPELRQYIDGHGARPPIKVIYGQQAYKQPTGKAADLGWVDELGPYMWWKKAAMTIALDGIQELYRLGDAQEYTTNSPLPNVSWCSHGDSKRIANLISIGDDEAEMQAAGLTAHGYESRRWQDTKTDEARRKICNDFTAGGECSHSHWPWVKLVKCRERPHVKQLCGQLQEILELLPCMVHLREHIRISMARPQDQFFNPNNPIDSRSRSELCAHLLGAAVSNSRQSVERSLRTQTA